MMDGRRIGLNVTDGNCGLLVIQFFLAERLVGRIATVVIAVQAVIWGTTGS